MKTDFRQLRFLHPILRRVLGWVEDETGVEFTETSSFRIGDSGVHGQLPVRGYDLRMRSEVIGKCIVKFINDAWTYDFKRPALRVAILHGKGSNMHIHIQVHKNTERKQ